MFFNLQHRAYTALNDVERNFSRLIGKVLERVYAILVLIAMFFLAAFMCWGLYKVMRTTKYAEIHREDRAWVSGSMPLPRIGYKIPKSGFSARLQSCSIREGDHSSKHCEDVVAHQSNIGNRADVVCFPSGLHVLGTYGDPMYRYVKLGVSQNMSPPSAAKVADVHLVWEQHITLFNKINIAQLYGNGLGSSVAHKIFFQKVVSILGTPLGFAGRQGEDESQQLLTSELAMPRVYEYTRIASSKDALSLYFRAVGSQREDFYECYSILKLLETSGGLWTSLLTITSLSALTSAVTYKHCARCFRC